MREHEVEAHFTTWTGDRTEVLTLGWENGGWTLDGRITTNPVDGATRPHDDVHYVVRTDEAWRVRQFLLFRDDDEPDLWLAGDGDGAWGEVNGAWRDDLAGCTTIHLDVTPVGHTLVLRGQAADVTVGATAEALVAAIDVETLQVRVLRRRATRTGTDTWLVEDHEPGAADAGPADTAAVADGNGPTSATVRVDEHALVVDHPGRFRRLR
jgi:uncharacterized protein